MRAAAKSRGLLGAATATVLTVAVLAGCSPGPQPTPTPPGAFASEEDAFAAAEKTYRAYIDALNQVDFTDSSTFNPVLALLSSEAESSTRKTFTQFYAEKITTTGKTEYDSFKGQEADLQSSTVEASVCLDVGQVNVLDSNGVSLVSPERPTRQHLEVRFSSSGRTLKISSFAALEGTSCDS